MAILNTIDTFPGTSAEAARVWDERYLAGVSAVMPPSWSTDFGNLYEAASPLTTFPMALGSLKYEATVGDNRTKTFTEKSFDLKVSEFDAGYEANLLLLQSNVFAYQAWLQQAGEFLRAEQAHINDSVKTLIETSGTLSNWDGVALFSASHKANPADAGAGTFSNLQATAADPSELKTITDEVTAMRGVLDPAGRKIGIEPDTILLPTNQYQRTFNVLAVQQIVSGGTGGKGGGASSSSNPFLGKFNLVHVPELADNDFYLVDSKVIARIPPWIVANYRPSDSLGIRHFLEDSDFFKNTGRLKVSSHLWYGFAGGFPHAIRKVTGKITSST